LINEEGSNINSSAVPDRNRDNINENMPNILEEAKEINPSRPASRPSSKPASSQEEISDYEDENFEPDETDEYWGI
jgi:hypothetical protein